MSDNTNKMPLSITKRAYDMLEDEMHVIYQLSKPEAVLVSFENDPGFVYVGLLLKRAMLEKGLCTSESSDEEFKTILFNALSAQDEKLMSEYGLKDKEDFEALCAPLLGSIRPIERVTLSRWINGDTVNIRNRSTCIRICMALELSKKQTDDFLNKCGFQSYNIRNAADAVLFYCTLNNKSLSEAIRIYDDYLKAAKDQAPDFDAPSSSEFSSDLTNIMEKEMLAGTSWENNDDFLNTFLIPNSKYFTAFSRKALEEYFKIKNPFFLTALKSMLSYESSSKKVYDYYAEEYGRRKNGFDKDNNRETPAYEIKNTLKFYNALEKLKSAKSELDFLNNLSDEAKLYYKIDESGNTDMVNNLPVLCDSLADYARENKDEPEIQKSLSLFISSVISGDSVFKEYLPATIDEATGRKRPLAGSELADTVLYKFPHRQSLTDYEKKPYDGSVYASVRKAVILMYYFAWAEEFMNTDDKCTYFDGLFEENTFEGFMNTVNAALARCRFAPLYPANKFDFLVLLSIRRIELAANDDEIYEARNLINDVIDASFSSED